MAKYKGRSVKLNKPFRTPGKSKKFGVYVRNNRTNRVQVVRFGDPNLSIKKNNPTRQRMFFARFRPILAKVKGQKSLSPAFWSMKAWRKGFRV
tara:strand:+ start:617 stop:895 length:279 start_codon:yes stop_codon:yes gene_type:complete